MTIACVGISVLDRVFRVDALPTKGGKYVSKGYFEIGGGPAATAAVTVRKLGEAVQFIGRAGSDDVAEAMVREFKRYDVGVDHLKRIDGAVSSFSAVLVDDDGERIIINHQDSSLSRDPEWLKEVNFAQFDSILCDVRWYEGAVYALNQAKSLGIPSVLDADITPENITELVALADHVAFSEPGLAKFAQVDDLFEGLKIAQTKTNGKVYVTAGSRGCYWLDKDMLCHQPGFEVDVLDTTGAGDVFHGALVFAVSRNMDIAEAIRFSSAVAALKCTQMGGRDGVPGLDAVMAFLEGRKMNELQG